MRYDELTNDELAYLSEHGDIYAEQELLDRKGR